MWLKMSKNPIKEKNSANYSLITLVLFWCGLIVMSSMYLTIPLFSSFSELFSVSGNEVALTSTVFCIFFAIGCLIYGPLSDQYGRKKIILIGMGILTIITPLVGLLNNIHWIIAFRGLEGLAAATFSPVALAYIAEIFPDTKKLTATGFLVTGFLMAGIIGQVISSFIVQYFSWNYIFLIMGLMYLITFGLIAIFLPYDNIQRPKNSVKESIKNIALLFKIRPLVLTLIVDVMLLMSMMCMYTALGYYLSGYPFYLSNQEILYIRAVGVVGILFAATSGILAKKFHFFNIIISGLLISSISIILIGLLSNIILITLFSVIFVAGIAIVAPSIIELIGQLGGKSKGAALSLHTVILFIGAGIGPILATYLLTTGINSLPYLVMGVALIIGAAISILIKKSLQK